MIDHRTIAFTISLLFTLLLFRGVPAEAQENDYLKYIQSESAFRAVDKPDKMLLENWDTWVYMPWRYKWTIGTGEAGGNFCIEYGINGGFTDHGHGPLEWLEKYKLKFYNDHTAGKGDLYLHGANNKSNFKTIQKNPRAIRKGTKGERPLNLATLNQLKKTVRDNVNRVKGSPMRIAYALDDEISWGAFVVPIPWRINNDDAAYQKWLGEYYQQQDAPKAQYLTPEDTRRQLNKTLKEIDFSPFLDRMTYNDSVFANFVGELVTEANKADPDTPAGFVGGQAPNLWGGYDYAKLMKKIQFIEAYDLGSAHEIVRSFNPDNKMPCVTTHFHSDKRGVVNDIWQAWYYFGHGSRGMIGWIDGWFDKDKPKPWLGEFKGTLKEIGGVQGKKLVGAKWKHDQVAIYYSHPSIQVSWLLDAQAHGGTWPNRGNDQKLGTSHLARKAWEYLLTDSGLQYNFIAYDEVIKNGISDEYKVLILPACFALSDIEAKRIQTFCENGGTVIADFMPGLFDQHGKGRSSGALDKLFGVTHSGDEAAGDFFGAKLWVETDQDKAFSYKTYKELFSSMKVKTERGYAVAENNLPVINSRGIGKESVKGRAILLNLSPQRYLQYREENSANNSMRAPFVNHVLNAGCKPWVRVHAKGKLLEKAEVTYWVKGNRIYVFVLQNVPMQSSSVGGGGVEGLQQGEVEIELKFTQAMTNGMNERTNEKLAEQSSFRLKWNRVEALLLSFDIPEEN